MTRNRTSREKLLKAALTVFSKEGYTSASVADIIKQASVARGTFYLYFESKRSAFQQVLAFVIEEIEKLSQGIPSGMIFRAPEDIYNRMLTSYARFLKLFSRNKEFTRIVFSEAIGLDRGFDEQLETHYETHRDNIKRFLECVRQSGYARSFHIDILTEVIIGYTERCARMFTDEKKDPLDIDMLARELTDIEFQLVCNVPLEEVKL